MANPKKPAKKAKGVELYGRIVKQFTQINKLLPEDRKLPVEQRRKIISDIVYPHFLQLKAKDRTAAKIKRVIEQELDKIPPKELCDVNFISPDTYAIIEWYQIDEFIETVLPPCVYVRVNCGRWIGKTPIFNTRNYKYFKGKVRKMIEKLRIKAQKSSGLDFSGIKKLRPNKTNDGTPENYFIDFVLNVNDRAQASSKPVNYKPPETKPNEKAEKKVREIIVQKLKGLKAKKMRMKRAKKTFYKNINKVRQHDKRIGKLKSPKALENAKAAKLRDFNRANEALDKDFVKGLFTPDMYRKLKQQLYKNFEQGGII